jgi:hypothetical protein
VGKKTDCLHFRHDPAADASCRHILAAGKHIVFKLWVVALVLVPFMPTSAAAWGREGHEIVATISQDILEHNESNPLAYIDHLRKQPVDIKALRTDTKSMALSYVDRNLEKFLNPAIPLDLSLIATWADGWRYRHPNTAEWHFVDLPTKGHLSEADLATFCDDRGNVVSQIRIQKSILKNTKLPAVDRLRALFFVVNLIGDLYQPLQCVNDGEGRGIAKKATFFGQSSSLQQIWDEAIIEEQRESAATIAHDLLQHIPITGTDSDVVAKGEIDQAIQSRDIARDVIIKLYPTDGSIPNYGREYEDQMFPVVRKQLCRSGFFLALALRDVCDYRAEIIPDQIYEAK